LILVNMLVRDRALPVCIDDDQYAAAAAATQGV
jgi:hypothetical protein